MRQTLCEKTLRSLEVQATGLRKKISDVAGSDFNLTKPFRAEFIAFEATPRFPLKQLEAALAQVHDLRRV